METGISTGRLSLWFIFAFTIFFFHYSTYFFLSFSLSKECYLIFQDKCCGVINYADWRNTIYGGHRYDKVPDSCCMEQKHACGFEFELSKIKRQVRYSIVVMWIVTWLNIMNFFVLFFYWRDLFSSSTFFVCFVFFYPICGTLCDWGGFQCHKIYLW